MFALSLCVVCYLELAKVCNIIIQPNGLAGSFQQGTRSAGSHQLARCGHNGKVYKHACRKGKRTESLQGLEHALTRRYSQSMR